ncbi:hypothetical protein J6590_102518 [Homalodisca vitripennis]|nr:hypothetical protein J6590_102518 [Homalodisca vitripennis]
MTPATTMTAAHDTMQYLQPCCRWDKNLVSMMALCKLAFSIRSCSCHAVSSMRIGLYADGESGLPMLISAIRAVFQLEGEHSCR